MIFETLIKENRTAFVAKVIDIAAWLMVKPEWLMFVMWFETARTLNHRTQNSIGATGLIQFMPRTAIALGTTTDALVKMSNVEQLDYVNKHLKPFRGKLTSLIDLYCAVFWPAAVGKPDTYTISSDTVARQNPLFDINKDTDITKAEIKQALFKQIPPEYKHLVWN